MNERTSPATAGAGPWMVTTAGGRVQGQGHLAERRRPEAGVGWFQPDIRRLFRQPEPQADVRWLPVRCTGSRGCPGRATDDQVRRGRSRMPASFPVLQGGLRHSCVELAALAAARQERDEDGHA